MLLIMSLSRISGVDAVFIKGINIPLSFMKVCYLVGENCILEVFHSVSAIYWSKTTEREDNQNKLNGNRKMTERDRDRKD